MRIDRLAAAFAIARLVVQCLAIRPYGYFRDELYYLACADHLAFGFVDHPPLSIALLKVWRAAFGDSLVSIRLVPALAGALTVYLTVRLAQRLGATPTAAALAGLALLCAPALFAFDHYYSMNSLDHLVWVLAGSLAMTLVERPNDRRAWLLLGVVLGLGGLNKWSVAWLAPGLTLGLLLGPARTAFRTRWPWIAAAVGLVIVAPNLIWQWRNGWPTFEFMHNAMTEKYAPRSFVAFIGQLLLLFNPFSMVFVVIGVSPLAWRRRPTARPLAAAFAVAFLIVAPSGTGKAEYLLAALPLALASGASAWRVRPALSIALASALLVVGIGTAPFGLPILSEQSFIAYQARIGIAPPNSERKEIAALPQFYADMHGWPELTDATALAWGTLSDEERHHAKIIAVTGGYGPAAAIGHFGRAQGLPHAISAHNSYWLWGYGAPSDGPFVLLGGRREYVEEQFDSVTLVTTFECALCMPYESHKPIWVARGLRAPWPSFWREEKHYE